MRAGSGRRIRVSLTVNISLGSIAEGFPTGKALGPGIQHQPDGFSRIAVIEIISGLAGHVKQQVSLAHGTAQQCLNGIHTTGIILRDANDLFIRGEGHSQQFHSV